MTVVSRSARADGGRFARSRLGALAFGVAVLATAAASIGATRVPIAKPGRVPATGRIEGNVVISASLTARRPQFRPYADPGAGSVPPAPPKNLMAAEVRNVVVYLETDSAKRLLVPQPEGRGRASMAQRDERFVPHILPVLQGATVDFPNEDDVYHNVFSLSAAAGPNRGFDLGRYPKGTSRSVTFSKPGIVQVFCHIHNDMSATVYVLSNPFFASPSEDHRYAIEDVPEGDYTIVGWHERIVPISKRVHVTAGQTATLDFNIPLPQGGSK